MRYRPAYTPLTARRPDQGFGASSESLMNNKNPYQSGNSTPSYLGGQQSSIREQRPREPYPSWTVENQIPMSKEEIEDVFIDLTNKFGFQRDSSRNQYDHLMIQLDSRSSRMSPEQSLTTLHADYIGGENANYRRWYFAAQVSFIPCLLLLALTTHLSSTSTTQLESQTTARSHSLKERKPSSRQLVRNL